MHAGRFSYKYVNCGCSLEPRLVGMILFHKIALPRLLIENEFFTAKINHQQQTECFVNVNFKLALLRN